jgi:hypothetical protein
MNRLTYQLVKTSIENTKAQFKLIKNLIQGIDHTMNCIFEVRRYMTLIDNMYLRLNNVESSADFIANKNTSISTNYDLNDFLYFYNSSYFNRTSIHLKTASWSDREVDRLHKEVINYAKYLSSEKIMKPYDYSMTNKYRFHSVKIKFDRTEGNSIMKFHDFANKVSFFYESDWQEISKNAKLINKSSSDCRVMWCSTSGLINYEKWSKKEIIHLIKIAEKYNGMRWDKVAQELATYRRPICCLQMWKRYGKFESFKDRVRNYENSTQKNIKINNHLNLTSCNIKLCKILNKNKNNLSIISEIEGNFLTKHTEIRKKARWTLEENQALCLAVTIVSQTYGKVIWIEVARHLIGRSKVQCSKHWSCSLDPRLNFGSWTVEEDIRLVDLVKSCKLKKCKKNISWVQIAKKLGTNRGNVLCKLRYCIVKRIQTQ